MQSKEQGQSEPKRGNALTLEQMLTLATDLGSQEAQGKDGQVTFDMKVAEAAFMEAVDLTKNKHGKGVDDATLLSGAYVKGRNAAVIFDHTEPKQRKLASNTRTMIKVGIIDGALQAIFDIMTLRQAIRAKAKHVMLQGVKVDLTEEDQRLDDAHNTLMRFARAQLDRAVVFTGPELKQFVFKQSAEAKAKTAGDVLESILNTASKLLVGEVANCPQADNSAEVKAVIANCKKRLIALAKDRGEEGPAPAKPKRAAGARKKSTKKDQPAAEGQHDGAQQHV